MAPPAVAGVEGAVTNPVPPACPHGHALESPGDRFCQVCGIAVRCSQGHRIDEVDAAFCPACGEALPAPASAVTRTPSLGMWPVAGVVGGFVLVVFAGVAVLALGGDDDDDDPIAGGGDVPATPTLQASSIGAKPSSTPAEAPTADVVAGTPSAVATAGSGPPAGDGAVATATATSPPPTPPPPSPTPTSTRPPATATPTTPPAPTATPTTAVASGECYTLYINPKFHESVQNPPPVESVDVTRSPVASPGCPTGEYREGDLVTLTTEAIPGAYPVWGASQESATRLECTHCQTTTLTMKGIPFFFVGPLYFAE